MPQVDREHAAPGFAIVRPDLALQREFFEAAVARLRCGDDRVPVMDREASQESRAEGDILASTVSGSMAMTCPRPESIA